MYFVSRQKFLLLSLKAKQNRENISKHILLHVEIFVARDGCSQKITVIVFVILLTLKIWFSLVEELYNSQKTFGGLRYSAPQSHYPVRDC